MEIDSFGGIKVDDSKGLLLDKILMEGIKDILLVIEVASDGELSYAYVNRVANDRTNLSKDVVGKALREVHKQEEFEFFEANHLKVIQTRQALSYEDSFLSPQGTRFYSQSWLTPLFDENGDVQYIVVLVHDITSKKQAELALKSSKEKLVESQDQFRIIAENSHDLIALISDRGLINYISPSCEELLGIDSTAFIGKYYTSFLHPVEKQQLKAAFDLSVSLKKPLKEKYRMQSSDGNWLWFELHGSPVFNELGAYSHFVAVSRDITTRYEYESKLTYFAYYDVLADLPNRRLFLNNLAEALEHKQVHGGELALMLMDIDKFKQINDEYGHDTGDLVIKEFADRLKKEVTVQGSTVARLGGDEFAVILPKVKNMEAAESIATNILRVMRNEWKLLDHTLTVTVSIGLAMASAEDLTNVTLLKKADVALYEAKASGRNRIQING